MEKKNVVFRNGKRVIARYVSAYDFADDAETLRRCFGSNAGRAATAATLNCFALAIVGARLCFGGGYVLECRPE